MPATEPDHGVLSLDRRVCTAWQRALVTLAVLSPLVSLVVVAGPTLTSAPRFRVHRDGRGCESCSYGAFALLLVIGIALLMIARRPQSPALGTFLAGVVLATSEYRHALETDVEPFKGLLLGLFFLAVGASIDFGMIVAEPGRIAALVLGLIAVKLTLLLALGAGFRLGTDQNPAVRLRPGPGRRVRVRALLPSRSPSRC